MLAKCIHRGPKDHRTARILHSGSKAQTKGIPETMVCSILVLIYHILYTTYPIPCTKRGNWVFDMQVVLSEMQSFCISGSEA